MADINLLYRGLAEHGIPLPNKTPDGTRFVRWGKNHRYWAIELNDNGYAFGDWTIPKDCHCVFDNNAQATSAHERRDIMKRLQQEREKERRLILTRQLKLSELAVKQCAGCDSAVVKHPYLTKKQISCPADVTYVPRINALLIPMYDIHGKIWASQTIFNDGTKRFMAGARKKGCMYVFGSLASVNQVLVCEGFATGASIFAATGITTVAAFDAGNITHVVHSILSEYPAKTVIVAADNDWESQRNTGYETAKKVVADYHIQAIVPQNLKPGMSDWNDIACQYGPQEIINQFKKGDLL